MLHDEDDYTAYFEDTMRAGHYENNRESVDIMIRQSRPVIEELLRLGVRFEQNEDGSLRYTREGGHSRARICFHKDITGKEITTALQKHVRSCSNITIMEHALMCDLLVEHGICKGIVPVSYTHLDVYKRQTCNRYGRKKKTADSVNSSNTKRSLKACHDVL